MLDFVIESDEKYYPHAFLKECKYVQEKIKFENYIDEKLDSDSDNDEWILKKCLNIIKA